MREGKKSEGGAFKSPPDRIGLTPSMIFVILENASVMSSINCFPHWLLGGSLTEVEKCSLAKFRQEYDPVSHR